MLNQHNVAIGRSQLVSSQEGILRQWKSDQHVTVTEQAAPHSSCSFAVAARAIRSGYGRIYGASSSNCGVSHSRSTKKSSGGGPAASRR